MTDLKDKHNEEIGHYEQTLINIYYDKHGSGSCLIWILTNV